MEQSCWTLPARARCLVFILSLSCWAHGEGRKAILSTWEKSLQVISPKKLQRKAYWTPAVTFIHRSIPHCATLRRQGTRVLPGQPQVWMALLSEMEGLSQGSPGLCRGRLWSTGMASGLLEGVRGYRTAPPFRTLPFWSFPQEGPCWARWQMCQT